MKRTIAMALALAVATPALAAPAAADPAALVRRLYASEPTESDSSDPLWWSYLTGRAASVDAKDKKEKDARTAALTPEEAKDKKEQDKKDAKKKAPTSILAPI